MPRAHLAVTPRSLVGPLYLRGAGKVEGKVALIAAYSHSLLLSQWETRGFCALRTIFGAEAPPDWPS